MSFSDEDKEISTNCRLGIQISLKVFTLVIVYCLLTSCSDTKSTEQSVIVAKVPPFYDDKFSDYGNFLRFEDFLFPPKGVSKDEIKYPKAGDKQGLPSFTEFCVC